MRVVRRRGGRIGCAAGAIASATLLATAGAAPALTLETARHTVTAAGEHHATAKCPDGTHVLTGGGVTAPGFFVGSFKHRNGWTVTGLEYPATATAFPVVAFAYCSPKDFHLQTFKKEKTVDTSTLVVRNCGPGLHNVSGGGLVLNGTGFIQDFTGGGSAWLEGGDGSVLGNSTVAVIDYAYCSTRKLISDGVQLFKNVPAGSTVTHNVACLNGEVPIGGAGGGGGGGAPYIERSKLTATGWSETWDNVGASTAMNVGWSALCH